MIHCHNLAHADNGMMSQFGQAEEVLAALL